MRSGDGGPNDGASEVSGAALLQLPPLPGAPGEEESQVDMQSLWREAVIFADLRSLEEPVNVDGEEDTGPQQADHAGPQEKPQSSQSRWLKYLEGDSEELGMEGECFRRQPLSRTEQLDPPFNTGLPRKRKRSQSTIHPSRGPDVWNPSDSEVPSEPQKDRTGLMGKVQEENSHKDTRELSIPLGDPAGLAHVRTTSSKWERFLLPPSHSPRVDMEPPVPLHRDPRPAGVAWAEQGALRAQTPREVCPSRPRDAPELPGPTHALTSGSQRPCVKTPEQPQDTGPLAKGGPLATGIQEPPFVRLCDLFKTGEDFEDDL
ncbi:MRN complex-interacting protein isoform X2 [Suricata suricatta]|uniref:MRN complex-interacting protein isoform X2 n=1 Tax=Suricata suricatta TaxID=37032 RepID=UPI0011554CF7|nr:MRN complex-interacting protein isoform X2 [Suricata suricatta]